MSSIASVNASQEREAPAARLRRGAQAAAELLLVIAALEVCVWQLGGRWNDVVRVAAGVAIGVIVIAAHRRRSLVAGQSKTATSDSRDTAAKAWLKTLAVTAALALLIPPLALATRIDGEGFRFFWLEKGTLGLVRYLAGKLAFIVVQQWLLQYFLFPTVLELLPHRQRARCGAAIVFGLIHLPSLLLVGITTVAGCCWLALFARGRRIAPLAASHLALAVLAHAALPERLTLNMRVGARAQELAESYSVLRDPQLAPQIYALCSDKYYAACGAGDDAFLAALYSDVLERQTSPSPAELAAWRGKLSAHARADIVVEFTRCEEFQTVVRTQRASHIARRVAQRLDGPTPSNQTSSGWR